MNKTDVKSGCSEWPRPTVSGIDRLPFPTELKEIVRDYCNGTRLYWQHWHHNVLADIYQRIRRNEDTMGSYYQRTGITTSELDGDWKEFDITPEIVVEWEQRCGYIKNVIFECLHYILEEDTYDATDEDNPMMQLIYEYTGWLYGFRLVTHVSQIRVVCIEHHENQLDSYPARTYIPSPDRVLVVADPLAMPWRHLIRPDELDDWL